MNSILEPPSKQEESITKVNPELPAHPKKTILAMSLLVGFALIMVATLVNYTQTDEEELESLLFCFRENIS